LETSSFETVIAEIDLASTWRHCEERSDEAISGRRTLLARDCFDFLAMTLNFTPSARV